ncbi:MAG: hypothetical protein HW416_3985, partial [Chloroflexi bacterium]|nr:hypothetical protein [Chloroflexota bacterium]
TIRVSTNLGGCAVSGTFNVTPPPTATPNVTATPVAAATCTNPTAAAINPQNASQGSQTVFTASGFAPGSQVAISVSGPAQVPQQTQTATPACVVTATFSVGLADPTGSYNVVAAGTRFGATSGGYQQSASYSVTGLQTRTPTPEATSVTGSGTGSGTGTGTGTGAGSPPTGPGEQPGQPDPLGTGGSGGTGISQPVTPVPTSAPLTPAGPEATPVPPPPDLAPPIETAAEPSVLWLLAFDSVPTYSAPSMEEAWWTTPGEWYLVLLWEGNWVLAWREGDPDDMAVWISTDVGVQLIAI